MENNARYHELSLERIRLEELLEPINATIAARRKESEDLEEQSSGMRAQLLLVRQELFRIYREHSEIMPLRHIIPEPPSTPSQALPHKSHDPQQCSASHAPASQTSRRSSGPVLSSQNAVVPVDNTREFPFAHRPPGWTNVSLPAGHKEPIDEYDHVTSGSNPAMLHEDLKSIVLLKSGWASIWCPICGANCPDGPRQTTYFTGMAGLRSHITQSHSGSCTGAYEKFVVDHGGSQTLGNDQMLKLRARTSRPEFRTGRKEVAAVQVEGDPVKIETDSEQIDGEVDDRSQEARERSIRAWEGDHSSQQRTIDQEEEEEDEDEGSEAVPQESAIERPSARFPRSKRNDMDIPSLDVDKDPKDEDDDEPVSASQKKQRRRQKSIREEDCSGTPAERAKTWRKSLAPGTYKLPGKDEWEWEHDEDGKNR